MAHDDLSLLLHLHIAGIASEQDNALLQELLLQKEREEEIKQLLEDKWETYSGEKIVFDTTESHAMLRNILNTTAHSSLAPVHRIHFLKTAWFRYAAAILLIAGVSIYLWNKGEHSQTMLAKQSNDPSYSVDIAPASTQAILTLASGKKILLDSSSNGHLVQSGGVEITTPNGGQYQVALPDGTKVWLNAASGIKFPATFDHNERRVEITGEAYLEVNAAHRPFVVIANGTHVQVLGTSFNVNAYLNEPSVKTTLLEGAIKIDNKILKPGQAYENGNIVPANMEQDLAWKNGLFAFNNVNVKTVMRQLSRWYNIEVEYEEGARVNELVYGKMQRNLTLSQVLKGLEAIGVQYEIKGNKLIVK